MNKNEILNKFLENVIERNSESDRAAFDQFIILKAKEIVSEMRNEKSDEIQINEFHGDGAIKLKGDDVLVNGKRVGTIKTNLNDMESGIDFVSSDGRFSKEFEDIQTLYRYIATTYGIKESAETTREKNVKRGNDAKKERNPTAPEGKYPSNVKIKEDNLSDGDQKLETKKVALTKKKIENTGKVLPHNDNKKKIGNGKKDGENISDKNEEIVNRLKNMKKGIKKDTTK